MKLVLAIGNGMISFQGMDNGLTVHLDLRNFGSLSVEARVLCSVRFGLDFLECSPSVRIQRSGGTYFWDIVAEIEYGREFELLADEARVLVVLLNGLHALLCHPLP